MNNRISEHDDGMCPCCGQAKPTQKIVRQYVILYGLKVSEIKSLEIQALNKGWKIALTTELSDIKKSDANIVFVLRRALDDDE